MKRPIAVTSTPSAANISCSFAHFAGGTARTIRSCASESQISQGRRPSYFSGTRDSSTSAPSSAGHFPHCRGEPSGAAIRDRRVQAEVAGPRQRIGQLLLDDGIADLDDAAKLRMRLAEHVRRKRRAMDAVAPRTASRTTIRSPICGSVGRRPRGASPTVPQKTSGLAM